MNDSTRPLDYSTTHRRRFPARLEASYALLVGVAIGVLLISPSVFFFRHASRQTPPLLTGIFSLLVALAGLVAFAFTTNPPTIGRRQLRLVAFTIGAVLGAAAICVLIPEL